MIIRVKFARIDGREFTTVELTEVKPQHLDAARDEADRIVEAMLNSHIDGVVVWADHPTDDPDRHAAPTSDDDEHIAIIRGGVRQRSRRFGA